MTRQKWVVLLGSFVCYLFDSLEIAILSFSLPSIANDLRIGPFEAGLIATATLIGMGVSGVVMGWVADTFGRKKALLLCMAVFASMTIAVALAPSYPLILLCRFVSGIGLGGVWGILSAYVVEMWPAKYRGRVAAGILSAFPVGGALAAGVSGLLLPDWRALFLLAGSAAIVPLVGVALLFPESAAWIRESRDSSEAVALRSIFSSGHRRITILASLVAITAFVSYYGASTWLPSYLTGERGLDTATVSHYMVVLNVGMFFGYVAFGALADRFGRKRALVASLIGAGVLMPIYGVVVDPAALLWLGPAYAFFMAFSGLFGSYLGELYPTRIRTTGAGFCFNIGRGVSAFAPAALGAFAAATSLSAGLILTGVGFLASGVLMTMLPATPGERVDSDSGTEAQTAA